MAIARTKVSERVAVRVRRLDDEFLVEVLVFGRVEERKTYFTNSKDDALATYADVVRRERLAESCATCDGSGEDPVGMPGEPCPDCEPEASEATSPAGWRAPEPTDGAVRHVVVVRLSFDEREWKALAHAAKYHGETRRTVVQTEARLGVEAEILAVESGMREGRK